MLEHEDNLKKGNVSDVSLNSSDMEGAGDVISKNLVTFSNIEGLVMNNRRLLHSLRDLSARMEEQENTAKESKVNHLEEQIKRYIIFFSLLYSMSHVYSTICSFKVH